MTNRPIIIRRYLKRATADLDIEGSSSYAGNLPSVSILVRLRRIKTKILFLREILVATLNWSALLHRCLEKLEQKEPKNAGSRRLF